MEGGSQTGAEVDVSKAAASENETAEATLGIDVSKYQGTIDWGQVKASGVDFAMVRVGYRAKTTGILYEDPGARYNLQEANANGIQTGAYFFSSAVTHGGTDTDSVRLSGYGRGKGLYADVLCFPQRDGRECPVEYGYAGKPL